ncbi:hypothetical protein B4166_3844 [Caldibacillus thermoamylovorans]|uniref:Uncharacterized protein n=1 Tax=Caldibacillus thermoamylovorans TaxID=35841 RepID=A0ABD4ABM9_9BACI|nr:hypothetical protein B4166_3844 [Caldibacillus thermoamylovorans]KIO74363.1 hypothetical protein B4167_1491 [Caldibacillus thermoamylovorans]
MSFLNPKIDENEFLYRAIKNQFQISGILRKIDLLLHFLKIRKVFQSIETEIAIKGKLLLAF